MITIPANTTIRTTDRKTKESVKLALPEAIKLTRKDVAVSLSENSLRTILAFQYKGRRATVKLSKVIRQPE